MVEKELQQQFSRCVKYKRAAAWRKPLLAPTRFVRNQLRMRGIGRAALGTPEMIAAFHMPSFTIVAGETVSETLAGYGVYEETLTEAFLKLVTPGSVVVDIGMHLGYYATLFARLTGSGGAVHAFEPTPSTRDIAAQNVRQFPQITVHPFAVWNRVEKLIFHDYGPQWMAFNSFTAARMEAGPPPPKAFEAVTTTLDEFRRSLDQPVSILKIDAESAEQQILEGAWGLLTSDRPIVSLEVGDAEGTSSSRSLIELLSRAGYTPWEFVSSRFVRHHLKQRYAYDNLIFAREATDLSVL